MLLDFWASEGDAISQYLLGPKEAEQHKDGLIEDMSWQESLTAKEKHKALGLCWCEAREVGLIK